MTAEAHPTSTRSVVATCFIAVTALAVAMGFGRFAFTPMLPLMMRDGMISQDAGAWLAASNYLGYLVGALVAGRLPLSSSSLMVMSLVGTAIATAAIGVTGDPIAWLLLRFCAGVLSAWTLVATSTWALRELARANRPWLAGVVYSGVGLGIAIVGLFCIAAVRPGVPAQHLWVELGALAAAFTLAPAVLLLFGRRSAAAVGSLEIAKPASPDARLHGAAGIIICYGLFGFGYILPATFLPALAREIVDDPRLFGLAWPIFGIAAAVSTIVVAALFSRFNRLRVWACCHLVMAAGVVLPTIWPSLEIITFAALLVGGTFMAITMLGLQEARSRSLDNPTTVLGQMTAAFALGQLAGPLASGTLDMLSIGPAVGLRATLQLAALGLATSGAALWLFSQTNPDRRSLGMSGPATTATPSASSTATPQGFGANIVERLPIPARETMNEAQRRAADAIIAGPRKAIFGPFVPLLQCPTLMEHIGKIGETLRFQGRLPEAVRELAICVVSRATSNQFEWQTHAPLAIKAGVAQATIDAISAGRRPRDLVTEQAATVDFVTELMLHNGVSDAAYADAVNHFGEPGVVELTALVGYFTMVCWIMNIARTPGPEGSRSMALTAFPM